MRPADWQSAVARGAVPAGVSRLTSHWAAGACFWRMVIVRKETELSRRASVAVKSTMPTLWSATGTSCLMNEGSLDVVASPEGRDKTPVASLSASCNTRGVELRLCILNGSLERSNKARLLYPCVRLDIVAGQLVS